MLRRYRCAVIAVFGWLILCGAQPTAKQAERGSGTQRVNSAAQAASNATPTLSASPSADFTPYPGYNPDPCYGVKDKDVADLCAQWRAAMAGEKAAHEARRATTWAVVATFLNALSLLAVGGALYLTIQSNRIARDTAKRQLRAYISIEPGGVNAVEDGRCRVPLQFVNGGQTPAQYVELFGDFLIISGDPRQFDPAEHSRFTGQLASSEISVAAQGTQWSYAYLPEDVPKPFWGAIHDRDMAIIHYGFVRYRDVFDEPHETHFAFYHWGEELSDAETKRCRFGNWST